MTAGTTSGENDGSTNGEFSLSDSIPNTSLFSARSTLNNTLMKKTSDTLQQQQPQKLLATVSGAGTGNLPTPSMLNQQLPPPMPGIEENDDVDNLNEEEEATKALMSQIKF